jgi:hypothetical protein
MRPGAETGEAVGSRHSPPTTCGPHSSATQRRGNGNPDCGRWTEAATAAPVVAEVDRAQL